MTLMLTAESPPLSVDDKGSVRVAGSRVLLEFIVHDHEQGLTAEQIAERYTSIGLADVYAVLSYYLRHKSQVDDYVTRRNTEAAQLRSLIEKKQNKTPKKDELLARGKLAGE
jgi:uncharacterized protein (DUF433 family)